MTTPKIDKNLATAAQGLLAVGLNMATAVPTRSLSPTIWIERPAVDSGTILLLGNGGQGFWRALQQNRPNSAHPVDDYCARVSEKVLASCLPGVARRRLFPDRECSLVLQRLMSAAGWHSKSPLGMGMHTDFGLWSACRAVWWLDLSLEVEADAVLTVDHCALCVDKPCLSACPGNALSADRPPLLSRCADYRLASASSCAQTCVSREACPIAAEHRYTAEQLDYHYGLARSAIRRYRNATDNGESD